MIIKFPERQGTGRVTAGDGSRGHIVSVAMEMEMPTRGYIYTSCDVPDGILGTADVRKGIMAAMRDEAALVGICHRSQKAGRSHMMPMRFQDLRTGREIRTAYDSENGFVHLYMDTREDDDSPAKDSLRERLTALMSKMERGFEERVELRMMCESLGTDRRK